MLKVAEEEIAHGPMTSDKGPQDLKPALERRCESLVHPAVSLEAAGKDRQAIRKLMATLLKSYEENLLGLVEDR